MSEPAPERVRVSGPLAAYADGFRAHLVVERGYSLGAAKAQLELVADASRWMESEGLDVASLTPRVVGRFVAERRRQGYLRKVSPRSLRRLLGYLDGLGVLPPAEEVVVSPVERLLEAFCGYLIEERGLAPGSVERYEGIARLFLAERAEPLADDLARLSGAEVSAFVLRQSRRRGQRSAATMACALRSLLRFLHVSGLVAAPLAAAVPSVVRRREDLPRAVSAEQVRRLLDSCERDTLLGCRDYAVLMLLARLGLRCGEVAALQLDDVDWRAGELLVRGKGSRLDRLPLPVDVGEALADYLCRGRPRGFGRTLLLRSCAPLVGLSRGAVSDVVVRACKRVGIAPIRAHRLRHTLASELLRHGAGLAEIGQVLRHQDLKTTATYAKIDRKALSRLALPWPGSWS
jgi:integrase/recombinase XerD